MLNYYKIFTIFLTLLTNNVTYGKKSIDYHMLSIQKKLNIFNWIVTQSSLRQYEYLWLNVSNFKLNTDSRIDKNSNCKIISFVCYTWTSKWNLVLTNIM